MQTNPPLSYDNCSSIQFSPVENYLFAPEIAESDAGLPARAPAEVVEAPDGAAVVAVVAAAGPAPSAAAPPAPPHARLGSALLRLGNGDQHQHRQQQHLAVNFNWVSVNTELYTCNLCYEAGQLVVTYQSSFHGNVYFPQLK